jgi:hypothetical protein
MRAVFLVVANILREPAFQVAFVNCNDVIQEITPATPYPTLCDSILPRTFERGADRIHPQGSNRCGHQANNALYANLANSLFARF